MVISESDLIKEVARRLNEKHIRYMFTGSIAANFYTAPRMTRNIDIVIELNKADADMIYNVLEKDFYIDKNMVLSAVRENGMFNVIHYESVFKIDFIVRKDNPYRIEELKRRREMTFEGTKLYITAPEDLILSKLFWAKDTMSEMQLTDVKNLLRSVKGLYEEYLDQWASYLGVEELFREVRQ